MRKYWADECCRSGWEDAQFYLASDVDKFFGEGAADRFHELLEKEARLAKLESINEKAKERMTEVLEEHGGYGKEGARTMADLIISYLNRED